MDSRYRTDHQVCDVDVVVVGNRLVGTDVFSDGSRSCLRQQLGTYQSPEHAAIMKEIQFTPILMVYLSNGTLTQAKIDQMAAELRARRIPGVDYTKPGPRWEPDPTASAADPCET